MKKIFIETVFLFLSYLCISIVYITENGNKTNNNELFKTSEDIELFEDIELLEEYNQFNGEASTMTLNTSQGAVFYYYGLKKYFVFTPTESMIMDLNYNGPNASLKVYDIHYFASNDYLFYSSNLAYDYDLLYLCTNQQYLFEFTSLTSSLSSMSITPTKVTSLDNHEKFLMHVTYDSSSALGYHYDIEYKNINLNSCSNTIEYINSSNGVTQYYDLLSNTLNFNLDNDNRVMVSNPGELEYSAISYVEANGIVIDDQNLQYTVGSRGTGTFVDGTTVLSCAHIFYSNAEINGTSYGYLPSSMTFYPGANSYFDSNSFYQTFGIFTATNSYVPISYLIYGNDSQYDWSISLTTNTYSGSSNHSYMRMVSFEGTYGNQVQFAGYPALYNCPTNDQDKYRYTMWTSYPLYNSITSSDNKIYSTDIISTGGNSGAPMFIFSSGIENGHVYYGCYQIGIVVAVYQEMINGKYHFNSSVSCKIRPVIINAYYEITS